MPMDVIRRAASLAQQGMRCSLSRTIPVLSASSNRVSMGSAEHRSATSLHAVVHAKLDRMGRHVQQFHFTALELEVSINHAVCEDATGR